MAKSLIGIVGPCGAGKSTLAEGLKAHGYITRAIAQEHSFVKDMWQRSLNWTEAEWQEQQRRLRHAREHADFYLDTDPLSISEVLEKALDFLGR